MPCSHQAVLCWVPVSVVSRGFGNEIRASAPQAVGYDADWVAAHASQDLIPEGMLSRKSGDYQILRLPHCHHVSRSHALQKSRQPSAMIPTQLTLTQVLSPGLACPCMYVLTNLPEYSGASPVLSCSSSRHATTWHSFLDKLLLNTNFTRHSDLCGLSPGLSWPSAPRWMVRL